MDEETFEDAVAKRFAGLVNLADIQHKIARSIQPITGRNEHAGRYRSCLEEGNALSNAALNYSHIYLASFADTQAQNPMRLNEDLGTIAKRISATLETYGGNRPEGFQFRLGILNTANKDAGATQPNEHKAGLQTLLSNRELGQLNSIQSSRNRLHKLLQDEAGNKVRADLNEFRRGLSGYTNNIKMGVGAFCDRETGNDLPPPYGVRLSKAKQSLLAELRIPPSNPAHQVADVRGFLPDHILGEPEVASRPEKEASGCDPQASASAQASGQEVYGKVRPPTSLKRSWSAFDDETSPSNSGAPEPEARRQRAERDGSAGFSI